MRRPPCSDLVLCFSSFLVGWLIGHSHLAPGASPSSSSVENSLTHIIIPLPHHQLPQLTSTLSSYWAQFPPCESPSTTHLVIILASPSFLVANLSIPHSACFASVTTCYLQIPPSLDTHIDGARFLYESILRDPSHCLPTPAHFALIFEPDVRPIRAHWLDSLSRYLSTSVPRDSWMVGSLFQGDASKLSPSYPFFKYHLNGAGLVNLSPAQPSLASTYFSYVLPYIKSRGGSRNAHDTDLFEFLSSDFDFLRRHAAHRIHATDRIINLWHTPWTLSDVLHTFPNAVLVHGGQPSAFAWRDWVAL